MPVRSVSAFFIVCLALGFWVNERSWNGQVYVYVGEERSPAAIRSLGEYSSIDRSALYRAAHTQLLAHAKIFNEAGRMGVQLGHPLMSRKGGGREFSCQVQDHSGVFDKIELVFVGTGVAGAGDPPRMIVVSKCKSEHNLNQLETLWIPTQEILDSPARDREFVIPSAEPVTVRLESIPDQWPDSWVLWSVKLYRDGQPEQAMLINTNQLRQARPKLLSLDWKTQ